MMQISKCSSCKDTFERDGSSNEFDIYYTHCVKCINMKCENCGFSINTNNVPFQMYIAKYNLTKFKVVKGYGQYFVTHVNCKNKPCKTCGLQGCKIKHKICNGCFKECNGIIEHTLCEICKMCSCKREHVKCIKCLKWDCTVKHIQCEICRKIDCVSEKCIETAAFNALVMRQGQEYAEFKARPKGIITVIGNVYKMHSYDEIGRRTQLGCFEEDFKKKENENFKECSLIIKNVDASDENFLKDILISGFATIEFINCEISLEGAKYLIKSLGQNFVMLAKCNFPKITYGELMADACNYDLCCQQLKRMGFDIQYGKKDQ